LNQYDAGIISVFEPTGTQCGLSFNPIITLFNYGSDNLLTVTITYDLDGGGSQTYNWTGTLITGASEVITLPNMTTTAGAHTFNVSTSLPNGLIDEDNTNDASASAFTVIANGNDVSLTLDTDCWGSEVDWTIQDATTATVASGGAYADINGGETISESFCLADGCYDFIINDSYGDGLDGIPSGCPVNGNYVLTEIATGNPLVTMTVVNYGNQATHNFCVPNVSMSADFSGTPLTVCEGESINFTDLSTGSITGWTWTFAGGTPGTSSAQNPMNKIGRAHV
jgi:PKD repeat protein